MTHPTKHLLILLAAAGALSGCGNGPPFCGDDANAMFYSNCERDAHCMLTAQQLNYLREYREKCGDR